MIDTLQNLEDEARLTGIDRQDIIESLTLQDIKHFLESLGVEQIEVNEEKGYLICPTICHNPIYDAESMKLYWYQNYKVFHCYTECNESMSIFKLYQKFIKVNENRTIGMDEAEDYVKHCLNHIIINASRTKTNNYTLDAEKYTFNTTIPTLNEYSPKILSYFTHYYHPLWLKDGITKEAMDKFKISFSMGQNKIIIPHFDISGRLVGIRARSLEKKEIEEFGKYRPVQIGNVLYSHPLQFNLYGIYEHQDGIRRRRSAIIVEGEKSVLLDEGFYGKFSNAVACCGSNFNKYHISLLTNILGASEIIVALDKEYTDPFSEKAKNYRKKIEELCRRYTSQANFSYIWDYNGLLEEKDSPYDKGKQVFEQLMKERVKIK